MRLFLNILIGRKTFKVTYQPLNSQNQNLILTFQHSCSFKCSKELKETLPGIRPQLETYSSHVFTVLLGTCYLTPLYLSFCISKCDPLFTCKLCPKVLMKSPCNIQL